MIIYNVDRENRIIACWFRGGKAYWAVSLYTMVDKITQDASFTYPYSLVDKALDDIPSFSARAKMHPDDIWDEELGKKIAKERLKDKFNKVKERVLESMLTELSKEFVDVRNRIHHKLLKAY